MGSAGPKFFGGTGISTRITIYNLNFHNKLAGHDRRPGGRHPAPASLLPGGSGAAWNWSRFPSPAVRIILSAATIVLAGCGRATVPCPTPTTELDRLRAETEGLRDETDRAEAEKAALTARRDAAAARAEEARAALDSLEAGGNR